jgi:hypothetical protein
MANRRYSAGSSEHKADIARHARWKEEMTAKTQAEQDRQFLADSDRAYEEMERAAGKKK